MSPKVTEALIAWRWFAREIEADLAIYTRRSIKEWLRGEMTSRELLVIIDGLPDAGSFKRWGFRGGDWSEAEYIAAETHAEIGRLRATMHVVHGGEMYEPFAFKSPAQGDEIAAADEDLESSRDELAAQLWGA